MRPNPQDLVTFTEESLTENFIFCAVIHFLHLGLIKGKNYPGLNGYASTQDVRLKPWVDLSILVRVYSIC